MKVGLQACVSTSANMHCGPGSTLTREAISCNVLIAIAAPMAVAFPLTAGAGGRPGISPVRDAQPRAVRINDVLIVHCDITW